jgi:hypothetical protein
LLKSLGYFNNTKNIVNGIKWLIIFWLFGGSGKKWLVNLIKKINEW